MMTDDPQQSRSAPNLDLSEAERLMIEAGYPDMALALQRYQEGMRNVIQADLVPGLVKVLESVVGKKETERDERLQTFIRTELMLQSGRYSDRVGGLHDEIIARITEEWKHIEQFQRESRAAWEDTARGLGKHEEQIATLITVTSNQGEAISQNSADIRHLRQDMQEMRSEHAAQIQDVKEEVIRVKLTILALTREIGATATAAKLLADQDIALASGDTSE